MTSETFKLLIFPGPYRVISSRCRTFAHFFTRRWPIKSATSTEPKHFWGCCCSTPRFSSMGEPKIDIGRSTSDFITLFLQFLRHFGLLGHFESAERWRTNARHQVQQFNSKRAPLRANVATSLHQIDPFADSINVDVGNWIVAAG